MITGSKSATLSKGQVEILCNNLGQTQSVMAAAVAKVHHKLAEEYSFKYAKLFGVLCIVMDRPSGSLYLKMFHPATNEVIFRMRVGSSFCSSYRCLNPYFMYFNYKLMAIGFSFADSDDLSNFELTFSHFTRSIAVNSATISAVNKAMVSQPLSIKTLNRIVPNADGLTLNFALLSDSLRKTMDGLEIRHSDYADIKASTYALVQMVQTKKIIRVRYTDVGSDKQTA